MDTPLKRHNGQTAGKNTSAQLQPERSIRAPSSFSPGAGITPLAPGKVPQCPSASVVWLEELKSSQGLLLLLHLYYILHRFYCLLRKELIWITGYHNFTVDLLTARSCHQQNRILSWNQDQEADYGVQPGFRLEDNHHGVPESFQKQNLVTAWFCKRTVSKIFPCNLCLVRSIFVTTFQVSE